MFEKSIDHDLLYGLLRRAEVGQFISYQEMGETLGHPVDGGTSVLQTVLRRLVTEEAVVFHNRRGRGYFRATSQEVVAAAKDDRTGIRRKARYANRKLSTIDLHFGELSDQERISYAVGISLFAAIAAATSAAAQKRLAAQVLRTDRRPLPFHETLVAFLAAE